MKITIIYDNTALRKDLQADWVFSCLVEADSCGYFLILGIMLNILTEPLDKVSLQNIIDIYG